MKRKQFLKSLGTMLTLPFIAKAMGTSPFQGKKEKTWQEKGENWLLEPMEDGQAPIAKLMKDMRPLTPLQEELKDKLRPWWNEPIPEPISTWLPHGTKLRKGHMLIVKDTVCPIGDAVYTTLQVIGRAQPEALSREEIERCQTGGITHHDIRAEMDASCQHAVRSEERLKAHEFIVDPEPMTPEEIDELMNCKAGQLFRRRTGDGSSTHNG